MGSCCIDITAQGARVEEGEANITEVYMASADNNSDHRGLFWFYVTTRYFVTPTSYFLSVPRL